MQLAVGRTAKKYRLLQEEGFGKEELNKRFYSDTPMASLSKLLRGLGYSWELITTNPLNNTYDVRITKQGSSFLVGGASSGEKELLTYLFAIFALNVRDALVLIDEPELHLHPKWQASLLELFEELSFETGNQFVLATHSPVFVSPASIQYVSRIYSEDQQSRITRLNDTSLPDPKHLFSIVNSQNNEKMFFADRVILVEGISDRLFFSAVLRSLSLGENAQPLYEVISVGARTFLRHIESSSMPVRCLMP